MARDQSMAARAARAACVAAWLAGTAAARAQEGPLPGLVILESGTNGLARVVKGREEWARTAVPPASTFKIVIAWAAISGTNRVIGTNETIRCADPTIPGAPRNLGLAEALYFSSNDFFHELFRRMGRGRMTEAARASGFFPGTVPEDWLGTDPRAVNKGGELNSTVWQVHRFTWALMQGRIGGEPAPKELEAALEWPADKPGVRVFGKTGAWGGVGWFTGFGRAEGHPARTVTVAVPYRMPDWRTGRDRAVREFFKRFGMRGPNLSPADARPNPPGIRVKD